MEYHVPKILDYRVEQGRMEGLGFRSEQAMESSHYDFMNEWEKVMFIL